MKYLIGLGFEKCGTTELHGLMRSESICSCPEQKELFFFNRDYNRGLDYYYRLFPTVRSAKVRVDVTPSYIRNSATLDRIEQFATAHDTKFVLCLRHPVKRAFSHYLHDLARHHVNQRGKKYGKRPFFEQVYSKSFFDHFAERDPYLFPRYSDHISDLESRFGLGNVLTLILEEDFDEPSALGKKLGRFINEKVEFARPWQWKNSFKNFPFYHYSKNNPQTLILGNEECVLERDTFYSFDGQRLTVLDIADEKEANEALEASCNWTRTVPQSFVQQALQTFYLADIEKVEELLNKNLDQWKIPSELAY